MALKTVVKDGKPVTLGGKVLQVDVPEGITPSGTTYIYENGTHDVANYATASVMVESPAVVYGQVYGDGNELALPKSAEGAEYFIAISSYKLPEADIVTAVFVTPKDKLTATYITKDGQQQATQDDVTLKNGVITLTDKSLSFDKDSPYNVVAWG